MSPELKQFMAQYSQRCNQQLRNALPSRVPGGERLIEAMEYSLLSGGKRIRPILTYASAIAAGSSAETPLVDAAASAVECIHAYSLIHDDLPAMDDDDLRRGSPTCHIAYGEATAILAGDALQTLAFEILAKQNAQPNLSLQLIAELSRASGAVGMVVGQAIDLEAQNQLLSLEQLEQMHNHKTGALIEAAIVMGAIATGATQAETLKSLRTYAKAIGLAFQVQDDILDVISNTSTLGKPQGSDMDRNKPTYVSLMGIDKAQQKARELVTKAQTCLQPFGDSAQILFELAEFIVSRSK